MASRTLRLPAGSGRFRVRCIIPSVSRSITWFSAAAPMHDNAVPASIPASVSHVHDCD